MRQWHATVTCDSDMRQWHATVTCDSDSDMWQWHAIVTRDSDIWHDSDIDMLQWHVTCDSDIWQWHVMHDSQSDSTVPYLTSGFCNTLTVTGSEDCSSLLISWTLKSLPNRKRSIWKTRWVNFIFRTISLKKKSNKPGGTSCPKSQTYLVI